MALGGNALALKAPQQLHEHVRVCARKLDVARAHGDVILCVWRACLFDGGRNGHLQMAVLSIATAALHARTRCTAPHSAEPA